MCFTSAHSVWCCWKWMDCILTSFQVEWRNQKPCWISQAEKLKSPGMLGPFKHHRCRNAASSHALEGLTRRLIVAPSFLGFRVHQEVDLWFLHGRSTWSQCWILTSFCIHFSAFHFFFYTLSVCFPLFSIPSTTTFGSLRRWPKRWVWMPRLQGKPLPGNLTDRVVHWWSKIRAWRWGCFVDFG